MSTNLDNLLINNSSISYNTNKNSKIFENVLLITFDPIGKKIIFSSSKENNLCMWDLDSGEMLLNLPGHTRSITEVIVNKDFNLAISSSEDYSLRIWDLQLKVMKSILQVFSSNLTCIRFNPIDENIIISGDTNGEIKIWNLSKEKCIATTEAHIIDITSLALTNNCDRIISGSYDKNICIWDFESINLKINLKKKLKCNYNILCLLLLNNLYIVSGTFDNKIIIWDLNSGEKLYTLLGHTGSVNLLAISPNNNYIVSSSFDKTLRLWNINTINSVLEIKCIAIMKGHEKIIDFVTFNPTGDLIISNSNSENKIYTWDINKIITKKIDLSSYPEINQELLKLLPNTKLENYIKNIISNFNDFSKYFIKNYMIRKDGTITIQNMDYFKLFTLIFSNDIINLDQLNIIKFSDYIISFIRSILPLSELSISNNSNLTNFYDYLKTYIINIEKYEPNKESKKFILNIYIKFIFEYIPYLNNYYTLDIQMKKRFGGNAYIITNRKEELITLLDFFKKGSVKSDYKTFITYNGEVGSNAGGLTRDFFKNIESQLNSKENIVSDTDLLDILALSRFNDNNIYIENKELKQIILQKILSSIKKNLNKNVVKYLLEYDSNNIVMESIIFSENNFNVLPLSYTNKNIINLLNHKKIENNTKNNTENNTKNNNKNNTENNTENNKRIINYIKNKLIPKFYTNFLDFYICHFIDFGLDVNTIIKRLFFSNNATEEFEVKFKGLLKNLSEKELKLFNQCISGTFKIQPSYSINIIETTNKIIYPTYHTCFIKMDINGINFFIENFLQFENYTPQANYNNLKIIESCKEKFIETLNLTLSVGYNLR